MKLKTALLAATCAAFTFTNAQAALELQLNTATKEFAIFGSDTGTPAAFFGEGLTTFIITFVGGSGSGNVIYNNDVAFDTNVGTPGNSFLGFDTALGSASTDGGAVFIQLGTSNDANQTITGEEVFQDYGSMPADAIARLEGTIGQSLPLVGGIGFSAMSVTAVVPEPSTYAALAGLATLGLVVIRRRKLAA